MVLAKNMPIWILSILCKLTKEKWCEREREKENKKILYFSSSLSEFPTLRWHRWAWDFPSSLYSGLGFRFSEERTQLILSGGLFLLHQVRVAFSDAPAIRGRHGRAERTTRGGLQLLPVITAGSEGHVKLHETVKKHTILCLTLTEDLKHAAEFWFLTTSCFSADILFKTWPFTHRTNLRLHWSYERNSMTKGESISIKDSLNIRTKSRALLWHLFAINNYFFQKSSSELYETLNGQNMTWCWQTTVVREERKALFKKMLIIFLHQPSMKCVLLHKRLFHRLTN